MFTNDTESEIISITVKPLFTEPLGGKKKVHSKWRGTLNTI